MLEADELLGARLARARAFDPAHTIRVLEPHVTERRSARLREVIGRRLASVRVVFDSPYDPHNGAAVIRSCEAFGVQRLDIVERERVRFLVAASVAKGSEKWLDVVTHERPETALEDTRAGGFELVVAHPEGELPPEALASIPRLALVVGNERDGVQDAIARACSRRVKVPMRGFVESLNVSVTTAILLHEATRGRPGDLPEADRARLYARGLYFTVQRAEEILGSASAH